MRQTGMTITIGLLCMLFGVACGSQSGAAESTPSGPPGVPLIMQVATPTSGAAIATPEVSSDTPEPATPSPQEEPFVSLLAKTSPLADPAPWLVFTAGPDESLYAIQAGQTEVTPLTDDSVWTFDLQTQAADGSTRVAYITEKGARGSGGALTLKTVSIPGGQVQTITELTSPETALTDQDPNDDNSNYWQLANIASAITFQGSAAWSPDGKWLAFVGAMDGPSADVYSYEVATGQIRQLTSGADQAYQLLWSPDSKWIVHIAQKEFARSGGVFEAASGVWAAAPDGSEVRTLDGPKASQFLGWIDADTLVVEGGGRMGPGRDLRLIHVSTASVTDLAPTCYESFAYSIPHNEYLVKVEDGDFDPDYCPGMEDWTTGMYLVKDGVRTSIERLDAYDYRWSDVWGIFFAQEQGSRKQIALGPDGDIVPDVASKIPSEQMVATENGDALAWIYAGSPVIATGPDYHPIPILTDAIGDVLSMQWSR